MNYQPMYQPMYGGYPQYQMPQQMPQQQMQAQQMQQAPQGIVGRVVSNVSEINADDTPTDGTVAWFPFADGSRVISRRMTKDWTVDERVYVYQEQTREPSAEEIMMGKIDAITSKLDAILEGSAPVGKHAPKEADNA